MTDIATVIIEVPLSKVGFTRAVGIDAEGTAHVFTRTATSDELSPEQSFNHAQAATIARRVLAGDQRTMTAPGTLRILAAAFLALDHQTPSAGAPV